MSRPLFLLLACSIVLGCAPAFPARPELPPMTSAQLGNAEASGSAPVIPKPDLSSVSSEVRAAAAPASDSR